MSKYGHRNLGWFEAIVNKHGGEEAADRFLRGETMIVENPKPPQPKLLSVIATIQLDAVTGRETVKCFVGPQWAYRDSDFDRWLSANQPSSDACVITTLKPSRDWTFKEAAATILGIGAGTDVVLLGNLLIKHGHTMTLVQVEEMAKATDRGEKTEMSLDWWNFFFVETGDPKSPVSVGGVRRDRHGWRAVVNRLGDDYRWYADNRLLIRNWDPSKL